MFRFIHTADIHLDSPLKSLALRDPQIADLVGGATRRTFEKIIDLCLEEQVDALIIAGDLYDGDLRSMETAAFFGGQMRILEEANILVFMIRGNHDSESSITKYLNLPKNVHVFKGNENLKELRELGVAIHGVSYVKSHAPESLLPKYRQPVPGLINIGMMHTSLAGSSSHDVYAPCALSELVSHGFDYWALGHIHQRNIYAEDPFVVMPGIPQGRDIGEAGPKSVTLVEITDKTIQIDERFIADSEFQRVQVDLSEIDDWQEALMKLRKALEEAQNATKARHLICRITLVGKSSLYWHVRRDVDLFEAEAKDATQDLNNVFIEGVDNQIGPITHITNDADPIDELETLMAEVTMDKAFQTEAAVFLAKALTKMPFEIRNHYGADQQSSETILKNLLSEGVIDVIATLKGSNIESEVN